VLGARGATGLKRLLLGSTAEEVVRHAHCPVLVTRWPASSGPVVAAADFSDPALPAITAAAAAANRMGAPLAFVHSIETLSRLAMPPHLPSEAAFHTPEMFIEGARQTAAADLDRALDSAGVDGEKVVLEGPPATAIVRFLEERNARLIVVGTTGKTGLRRMLLGSVAEAVVRTAPCSVLVVRLAPKD
jgi:nucleotide-binding universal stress UspA family protein